MDVPPGPWVTIEDLYDHDRHRLGPFPDREAAATYCDAYNGAQLKLPATGAPAELANPTDVGVWNLATCDGYDQGARLRAMLAAPASIPLDAAGLAAGHGALGEHEWIARGHAAIGAPRCWCAPLIAGAITDAPGDVLAAYLALGLTHDRDLFETSPHDGDAGLSRCGPCGGAVLHLRVELESVGDGIHHYHTPLGPDDLAALASGALDGGTCERWVGERPGLYRAGYAVCCYARADVGYIGVDHRLHGTVRHPVR